MSSKWLLQQEGGVKNHKFMSISVFFDIPALYQIISLDWCAKFSMSHNQNLI